MAMPLSLAHCTKASPRNSGPLSVRRTCGRPWSDLSCSKMRIRRVDEIEVSTSMCSASRLKSSTTLKVRKRSEEHTSELQSLMRISYAGLGLKKKKDQHRVTKE